MPVIIIIDCIGEIWQTYNLPDMTSVMQHRYQIKWPFETGTIQNDGTLRVTFRVFLNE